MNLMIALKMQSCKLYNNKYIIAFTQVTITEIFVFKAVVFFKLLNHDVLLQTGKTVETVKK